MEVTRTIRTSGDCSLLRLSVKVHKVSVYVRLALIDLELREVHEHGESVSMSVQ